MNTTNSSKKSNHNKNNIHGNINYIRNDILMTNQIKILHKTKSYSRNIQILLNNKEIFTPLIVPSISSARGPILDTKEILDFLDSYEVSAVLASLYE